MYYAGSSGSANQQTLYPTPTPLSQNPTTHTCQWCSRSFSSKTGLGVHMRRAHADQFDQINLRTDIKARWSEEETLLMAKKEAELTVRRDVRFMNQALAEIFPNRSLEAIKKARQKAPYRDAVRNYLDEFEAGPSQPPPTQSLSIPSSTESTHLDIITSLVISESDNSSVEESQQSTTNSIVVSESDNHLLDPLLTLPLPRNSTYNSAILHHIVEDAIRAGKEATLVRLSSYLLDILPGNPNAYSNQSVSTTTGGQQLSRRKQRRRDYALTQRNWSKHQNRCIKSILDGPSEAVFPPKEIMEPYWRTVMEVNDNSMPPNRDLKQPLQQVWSTITLEEIKQTKPALSTSPGPDGITPRQLRAIPDVILARIFNLILWCGKAPLHLREARTIFIPKKTNSIDPGDFRPITIPSVILRQLHCILAKRLSSTLSLDPRQRAFLSADDCNDNTTMTDLSLRDHHSRFASCYLTSLDVSKAFDSVSHNSIFGSLESYGLPTGFTRYMTNFYATSTTRLVCSGWTSAPIHPKRGVKQGDPLSPIIFNIIMDRLLRSLPSDIGCYIGTVKTNAIAFADDLVLFASTPPGLSALIDHTQAYLTSCGMTLNSSKCKTISIKGQPKQKRSVIEQRTFMLSNREIPALKRTDEWYYLGIPFTPEGKCKYKPQQHLIPKLDKITKAPLKPQQRLHALRTVIIPQLYHKLTLGNVMIGCLNKTDKVIRSAVRKWLDLPKDVTIAFFHAPVDMGGLGIPSLRWQAPWLRKERLSNLQLPNLENVVVANTYIATEIDKATKRLQVNGHRLITKTDITSYWSNKLHNSVDGFGLREAGQHKQAHRWIREPSKLLSGRDFINCIKLRINALPSRSRTSRGRNERDRMCRAGCRFPETVNHIVQQCRRTHGSRMDRHNSVVNYVARSLRNRGFTTTMEPVLRTPEGEKKPDIVATMGRTIVVVDAQVVTDGRDLNEAHRRKIAKYDTPDVRQQLRTRFGGQEIYMQTATLNWRGVWSGSSIENLLAMNILKKKDTALISTRVLIGGVRSFRIFNRTTSFIPRQGVG